MTHYQLVSSNKLKSVVVITLFVSFIGLSAYVMARGLGYGLDFVGFALVLSGVMTFASYWWSDKIVLAISKARPATREEFFDFYTVAENLAASQRLPQPKLYVIDDSAMNAFATGRDPEHAVICATTGILARLERSELEGVIAHELSHIKNYDIRLMGIVAILVGFVALLADMMLRATHFSSSRRDRGSKDSGQIQMIFFLAGLVLALLSPIIAKLIQLAISRRREFFADASSVAMTKNPQGLADALLKISQDKEPLEVANKATAHLYFSDPLKNTHGAIGWFANLFQTHPPVNERIKAIQGILK